MTTDEGLIRAVGVRGLTAGIINYMVGAGIFVVPAVVAGMVGAAAPIIYVVCAVAMALIVMCFAEAGSRVSLSGGTYGYAEVAFGPCIRIWQISPFGLLLQTYSPNGAVLKEFPPWCCFVRGLHGFCMENASFNGEFVSTGHVDGNPLLLLAISG